MRGCYLAFRNQRVGANKRGIKFEFTYAEWIVWWHSKLGPNWFYLRGPKPTDFCMARKDDTGPYTPRNVLCVTNRENRNMQVSPTKGEKNHHAKLNSVDAITIRTSKLMTHILSKRYKVSLSTIKRIRAGTTWK